MSGFKSVFRIATLLAVTAFACTPATSVPDPPDLTATANLYDAPTGTLDAANVVSFLSQAQPLLALVNGSDPESFLAAVTRAVATKLSSDDLPDNDQPVDSGSVRVDAVVTDDQTCLAWDAGTPVDPATNGTLHVQTVVKQSVLSRVLWGTADHCHLTSTGSSTIDGAVSIYRYDSLQTQIANARFLIRVDGTLGSDTLVQAAFDFRVSANLLEVRMTLESGDVIALFAQGKVGIHAKNGTFWCDTSTNVCTSSDGTTTVAP